MDLINTTRTTRTTIININPIIKAISCPESEIYLSLDLQPLWVCNLVSDGSHQTQETNTIHETPKYNYSFPTSPALNPNSPLTPTTTYYKLTPIFYLWIKQQLQLTQILYKQNKISFAVYSEWRSKFHAIKEFFSKRCSYNESGVNTGVDQNANQNANQNNVTLPQYIHDNASELISTQITFTETQINSYSQILPPPIEIIDLESQDISINPMAASNEQVYQYANQIAPAIFNQWLNLTQAHYPFYCNTVGENTSELINKDEPPLTNIYCSMLWLSVAWQAFIQKANIVLSVIRDAQQKDPVHDYRLKKYTIFAIANIFNKTFKDLYKKASQINQASQVSDYSAEGETPTRNKIAA